MVLRIKLTLRMSPNNINDDDIYLRGINITVDDYGNIGFSGAIV